MKKNGMRVTSLFLAAVMLASAPVTASAADTSANVEGEVVVDQTSQDQTSAESQNQAGQDQTSAEAQDQSQASAAENAATGANSDNVTIQADDKPYLALGADLTDAQKNTVLSLMGIDPANLGNYDVVYTTNAEEHQYLDSYLSSSVIGTHALITGSVAYRDLGLVVTDEQHRFGVAQRAELAAKGDHPHILVMSATPIPRTLALILYGDLDVSIIDQLPPGRQPVQTFAVTGGYHQRVYRFIRKLVGEGRQAYIVCPMVEENDQLPDERKAVTEYAKKLQSEVFPDLKVAFVHGKMKPKEKEKVMAAFAAGESDILVSTTVVEVGVDVPNATCMVVENADRFGLSQLHQLRGRVGRGKEKSYCILLSDSRNEETRARLKVMTQTNDGFVISQEDLRLRGPGDFFGQRQHGLPAMKIADLSCDMRLLDEAQTAARQLMAQDPELTEPTHQALRDRIRQLFDTNADMLN